KLAALLRYIVVELPIRRATLRRNMGTNKLTKKRARKGSRKGSGCRGQCYSPLPPKIRRFKSGR
ncbi:hypothetical protein LSH36_37g10083, partial [Paralvinella palmiformis]